MLVADRVFPNPKSSLKFKVIKMLKDWAEVTKRALRSSTRLKQN